MYPQPLPRGNRPRGNRPRGDTIATTILFLIGVVTGHAVFAIGAFSVMAFDSCSPETCDSSLGNIGFYLIWGGIPLAAVTAIAGLLVAQSRGPQWPTWIWPALGALLMVVFCVAGLVVEQQSGGKVY